MSGDLPSSTQHNELRARALSEFASGKITAARGLLEDVLRENPDDTEAWEALGHCLAQVSDQQGAAKAYGRAWSINPTSSSTAHQLGRILLKLNQYGAATSILTAGAALNPGSETMWCDLGTAQTALKRFSDAENSFRHAAALNPNFALAVLNLGSCLREQGRPEEAITYYNEALSIDPDSTETVTRLAASLSDVGRTEDALRVIDRFLEIHPNDVECHQNKALILLRAGKIEAGFEEYEWRLYPSHLGVSVRPFPLPRWQGDSLSDRKLLIWLEQGIGDEILSLSLWSRYLSSEDGNHCMIECEGRLSALIERSFPSITVVARKNPPGQETKRADVTCPAWSVARLLGKETTYGDIKTPYLFADPLKTASLRREYERLAEGRKIVGLSWSSAARKGNLKTPPITDWEPIVRDQDYFFVSLQYGQSENDVAHFRDIAGGRFHIDTTIDTTDSFDDHAAQVSALDAVVTISNSTAHLAGALGVATATIVPSGYGGFWYWFRDRADSPWYPSMHICRQTNPGNWPSAVADAHDWLKGTLCRDQPLS